MILESHFRLTLSVLFWFSLAVVHLTGASPTMEPSITAEQCPQLVSGGLRSSSPPPTVTPASSPSSMSNPMMLRSTRLCQRGCTLIASLCYSAFMLIPQGSFAMELLWYYYSCIWLGVEQSKTGGFFPLVSLSKKNCRNFNIQLDVLFKLICMKNITNCITGIIRFLFFSFSHGLTLIWPCFSIPVFSNSCEPNT